MPFSFEPLDLAGAVLVRPRVFGDERGFFMESYRDSDFAQAGIVSRFVQTNLSYSKRGVLRGLHFQRPPKAQAKLVQVIQGEIYDVFVDIRPESPSFGQWRHVVLSATEPCLLYVPSWCAHGFCVTSDEARVSYSVSEPYSPEHESGVLWNDGALGITWPVAEPIIAPRDAAWPSLQNAALGAVDPPHLQ